MQLVETAGKPSFRRVWQARRAVCSYMSPLVYRHCVYYVNAAGVLYCLDARTGVEHYAERLDSACWATPIAAGDRIYFFGKNGVTTVVKAGPSFQKVASNRLWEPDDPPKPSAEITDAANRAGDAAARPPSAEYLDPIVYGVAAARDSFFVRIGTRLYCLHRAAEPSPTN